MKNLKLSQTLTIALFVIGLSSCTRSSPEKVSDSAPSPVSDTDESGTETSSSSSQTEEIVISTPDIQSSSSSIASISSSSETSSENSYSSEAPKVTDMELVEESLATYSDATEIRDQKIIAERNKGFISIPLEDSKVLVAGGIGYGCGAKDRELKTAEIFDTLTKESKEISKLKTARAFASSIRLKDGRILISGGTYCRNSGIFGWAQYAMADVEVFDPQTQSFEKLAPMKNERSSHFSLALQDEKILVIGGRKNTNSSQSAEIFDPNTNNFEEITAPRAWDIRAVHLLLDGRVLILDTEGLKIFDTKSGETKNLEQLGPKAKEWVEKHPLLPQF